MATNSPRMAERSAYSRNLNALPLVLRSSASHSNDGGCERQKECRREAAGEQIEKTNSLFVEMGYSPKEVPDTKQIMDLDVEEEMRQLESKLLGCNEFKANTAENRSSRNWGSQSFG